MKFVPEWCNACWKIVRFGGEYNMLVSIFDVERTSFVRFSRAKCLRAKTSDGATVITEFDDVIWIGMILRFDNHVDERFFLRFTIDDHLSLEKPVTAVFAVGLGQVEAFYAGRIAF